MLEVKSLSPLQKWLNDLGVSQVEFALAADVCSAEVQAVCAGYRILRGPLRNYIDSLRTDIALEQDAWFVLHQKEVKRQVAEKAA